MANEEHVEILRQGVEVWNELREDNPTFQPNLAGANLGEMDLSHANLRKANLSNANLSGANLSGANLDGADLSGANLTKADLSRAKLSNANLIGADLSQADLSECTFESCNLRDANLTEVTLTGASFTNCIVSSGTNFIKVVGPAGCVIDRYMLESLASDSYGGLSRGDLMVMEIRDDVAVLRRDYSGFWKWGHILGLLTFIGPYLWFLGARYVQSKFDANPEESIALWNALLRYIVSAGHEWKHGWELHPAFGLFVFLLAYNLLRAALLLKTLRLEHEQEIRGLPVRFSLVGAWGAAHTAGRIGFYGMLMIAVLHALNFLTARVPI